MSSAVSQTERDAILSGLSSSDEEVRRLSVEQLVLLPLSDASARLVDCLGDPAWRVRKAAVERLVACRDFAPIQEMLVQSLGDGENPGRRNAAFEALVGSGSTATARLVAEMSNGDVDVRKLAVDALAAIGDPETRAPLVVAIGDPDANVRAAVAEALGVVGGAREIECLLAVATDSSEELLVRLSALRAMARMEASVGVANLGEALEQSLLRPAAYELLGHSTDPSAAAELIKGLSENSRSSCEAAMGGLLRTLGNADLEDSARLRRRLREVAAADDSILERACERLESADLASCLVLIQFLGLLHDPRAVVPILRAGRDEAIAELADATVEGLGDQVPAALAARWSDLEHDLKTRAVAILGSFSDAGSERLLADALESADGELRCRAAKALGEGGFFQRMPELVQQLENAASCDEMEAEDEVATVIAAIVALAERSEAAQIGIDVQLIEVLSSRLGGATEPVRLAIAKVLARLGREQDQDIIERLLRDVSPAVRRAAVESLGRFGIERAREAIRLALGDESSSVRIAAANVLGESGGPEAAEDLRRLMADDDPRVGAVSVRATGHLFARLGGAAEAAHDLIGQALGREPVVALAAIDALMELGGDRAAKLALSATARPEAEIVRSAVACLGRHADVAELLEATPLAAHSDWSVRAEVAQVLADRACRKGLPALLRRLEVEDDPFVRETILRAIRKLEE